MINFFKYLFEENLETIDQSIASSYLFSNVSYKKELKNDPRLEDLEYLKIVYKLIQETYKKMKKRLSKISNDEELFNIDFENEIDLLVDYCFGVYGSEIYNKELIEIIFKRYPQFMHKIDPYYITPEMKRKYSSQMLISKFIDKT